MKFGKHLLSSALPEWLESYLDYKALKRAIKVQAQTGDTSLFDTLLMAEIKKADEFHKAREEDLLLLFAALVNRPGTKRSTADEKTPLLSKPEDVTNDEPEAWRSMPREEIMRRLDEVEALATNLLKFSALNYTGVSKSLKKSFKKTGISSEDSWLPRLHDTHFFRSRKCDEVLTKTTLIRREIKADDRVAKQRSSQGDGAGSPSSSSSTGAAADESPSLWAFILGTFVHQIADNANKLVVPLVYLQLTSVGVMSILTGVMTLLQTFGTLPAGRWASAIGPKALIQWITVGRALLTSILAVVFLFYSNGTLGSGFTLFLVTLITSADWFIRGAIDTARNVLPMAYSQNSKKMLDEINIRFFTVFELGALVGPLVQGIILALGWGLGVTLWVPVIFLVLNVLVNFWIPETDSSKYSFLQSDKDSEETADDDGKTKKKNKKKPSLLQSYITGIKECIDPTIGLLFILVILLQLNKIRLVIPQIIAVELFNDDSYAAWIFSTYSLGGVIGSGVYALVKNIFSPATNMVFASAGVLVLAVSWWPALAQANILPFLPPKDEWLLWVLLGAMTFSIVKQSARTSLQSIFQYALRESKSAADIMALNRFGVNGLATGLRFALGIPFIFLSVNTAFLSISGGLAVISTVMFIGTYLLTKLPINKQHLKDKKEENDKAKADGKENKKDKKDKKKKKKSKKRGSKALSDDEVAQLVDIPKDTGVLIVFEGLDGAGKSTQVERLKSFMQGEGYVSLVTTWSKSAHHYDLIRQLKRQTPMRSILLTVVQAMDFQQMIKQDVIPALRAKKVVLCDRYFYTGIARGVARGLSKTWLRQLFTADVNLEPDLVLYHQCVAAVAVSRVLSRSNSNTAQLSDDSMTHRVIVTLKSKDGKDASRDLSAARISVYEAGLDVANPQLDPYDNFVSFQTRVSGEYDAMIPEYHFKVVDGTGGRDEQESKVRSYVEPMLADLKKEVSRPFKTNLFDKNPKLDSGKKVKEYYLTKDGLHWYFRTMYFPMRNRLGELVDLSKAPRVFLHGNPHINNFARFSSGSAMIDFDRSCIGPYLWDLVRLMVSTAFKQDGQDEIGGTFLRQGVLQRLKTGYEWGLLHKNEPSAHPHRNDPFTPEEATVPAPGGSNPFAVPPDVKGRLSMQFLPSPETAKRTPPTPPRNRAVSFAAPGMTDPSFYLKRLDEMRKNHADIDDALTEMAATYLEALGEEGKSYVLVEAGVSPNWSGRTRTLLLFKKKAVAEDEADEEEEEKGDANEGMLVDIKPVRTDPDDKFFHNPYKPDYGMRMLKAQELYADGYIHHSATFFFKSVQYFAHEIPSIKMGVKRPLTEADQRDILYAVGTQLGRGHALSVQEGLSVSHILFHLNFSWPQVCEASERLKDELTSAYRRYLTVAEAQSA